MQKGALKALQGITNLLLKAEPNRIALLDKTGKTMAEITFPAIDANTVEIDHSFVDPSLRGQGIAGKLVQAAVEQISNEGKKAIPTCSYVKTQFDAKPEYQSLIPPKL